MAAPACDPMRLAFLHKHCSEFSAVLDAVVARMSPDELREIIDELYSGATKRVLKGAISAWTAFDEPAEQLGLLSTGAASMSAGPLTPTVATTAEVLKELAASMEREREGAGRVIADVDAAPPYAVDRRYPQDDKGRRYPADAFSTLKSLFSAGGLRLGSDAIDGGTSVLTFTLPLPLSPPVSPPPSASESPSCERVVPFVLGMRQWSKGGSKEDSWFLEEAICKTVRRLATSVAPAALARVRSSSSPSSSPSTEHADFAIGAATDGFSVMFLRLSLNPDTDDHRRREEPFILVRSPLLRLSAPASEAGVSSGFSLLCSIVRAARLVEVLQHDHQGCVPSYAYPTEDEGYAIADTKPLGNGGFCSVIAVSSLRAGGSDRITGRELLAWKSSLEERSRCLLDTEYEALTMLDGCPFVSKPHAIVKREGSTVALVIGPVGTSLDKLPEEAIKLQLILQAADDILRALEHCRARGVVHWDVCPANIIATDADSTGDSKRYVLIDFGLWAASGTKREPLRGHIQYLHDDLLLVSSPSTSSSSMASKEVEVSPSHDLYSLGCTLVELWTRMRGIEPRWLYRYLTNLQQERQSWLISEGWLGTPREIAPLDTASASDEGEITLKAVVSLLLQGDADGARGLLKERLGE